MRILNRETIICDQVWSDWTALGTPLPGAPSPVVPAIRIGYWGTRVEMPSAFDKTQTACRTPGRRTPPPLLSHPASHRRTYAKMSSH